jgi:putative transposase
VSATRARLKTFEYRGNYRYSLTFCTEGRCPAFSRVEVVEATLGQILRTALDQEFHVLAYCFMPDHLHLIVEGASDQADLRHFVRLAKQRSGYQAARLLACTLWQASFYDRVLRDSEPSIDVIKYVLGNPVRAGLAKCIEEYPFLGSGVWSRADLIEAISEQHDSET